VLEMVGAGFSMDVLIILWQVFASGPAEAQSIGCVWESSVGWAQA